MIKKPSMSGYNGQYDKIYFDNNNGGTVEWQPGDGTRYILVAKMLSVPESRLLGSNEGAMIISMGPGEPCLTLILNPGHLHHISYIEEKSIRTKFSEHTLKAVTAFLNLVIGDENYGILLYNEMMAQR